MRKIIITLQITDPETVEDYIYTHPDLVFEDILHGTLAEQCEMVSAVVEEE